MSRSGVAAFQIVTVAEVITAAFAVPMVAMRPRTATAISKRYLSLLARIIHEVGEAGFLRRLGGAVFGGVGDAAIGV